MNHRDRVFAAINFEGPDRVPLDSWFTRPFFRRLCKRFMVNNDIELRRKLGLDLVETLQIHVTESTFRKKVFPDNTYIDEFGTKWRIHEYVDFIPIHHPIQSYEDLDDFIFPDPDASWRFDIFYETVEKYGDEFFIPGGIGFTLFERAWVLRGFENFLMDFYRNPDFVEKLLDKITEYNVKLAQNIVKTGIDMFYIGDDYGTQQGLIMPPAIWRKFFKPRLEKIFKVAKNRGLPVALHSDGNIYSIIKDLIEIGLDVLNPCMPHALDLHCLHREFGDRLVLWGTLDTQYTLPFGTQDDVAKEVEQRIQKHGKNGGLILAPVHTVLPEVPIENYLTFITVAKNMRLR